VTSFEGRKNLLNVINNGLVFLVSGISVDDRFRLDEFLGYSKLLSLFSSKSISDKLNTSLDPLGIRVSYDIYKDLTEPFYCFRLEIGIERDKL
jgi:hypothetical protein